MSLVIIIKLIRYCKSLFQLNEIKFNFQINTKLTKYLKVFFKVKMKYTFILNKHEMT